MSDDLSNDISSKGDLIESSLNRNNHPKIKNNSPVKAEAVRLMLGEYSKPNISNIDSNFRKPIHDQFRRGARSFQRALINPKRLNIVFAFFEISFEPSFVFGVKLSHFYELKYDPGFIKYQRILIIMSQKRYVTPMKRNLTVFLTNDQGCFEIFLGVNPGK